MKRYLPILVLIILISAIALLVWVNLLPEETLRSFFTPKIQAVSDIPGFSLSIANPKKLDGYLTDFGLWKENEATLYTQEQRVTIKRLVVHLTDQEQEFYQVRSKGVGVYQATGEVLQDGTLHLFVFIAPWILEEDTDFELSQRIDGQVLKTVYRIGNYNPRLTPNERFAATQKAVQGITTKLRANNETLFKVERKK